MGNKTSVKGSSALNRRAKIAASRKQGMLGKTRTSLHNALIHEDDQFNSDYKLELENGIRDYVAKKGVGNLKLKIFGKHHTHFGIQSVSPLEHTPTDIKILAFSYPVYISVDEVLYELKFIPKTF